MSNYRQNQTTTLNVQSIQQQTPSYYSAFDTFDKVNQDSEMLNESTNYSSAYDQSQDQRKGWQFKENFKQKEWSDQQNQQSSIQKWKNNEAIDKYYQDELLTQISSLQISPEPAKCEASQSEINNKKRKFQQVMADSLSKMQNLSLSDYSADISSVNSSSSLKDLKRSMKRLKLNSDFVQLSANKPQSSSSLQSTEIQTQVHKSKNRIEERFQQIVTQSMKNNQSKSSVIDSKNSMKIFPTTQQQIDKNIQLAKLKLIFPMLNVHQLKTMIN